MAKGFPMMRWVLCLLYSDGSIMCMPPYNHLVACSADLRRWPYDTHTCTMMIGSWTHTNEQMNISLMEPSV
jgi:nicotinic acetylcholine receptor